MARTSTSGQGRKKGVPNKATREIKDAARQFGPAAVRKLAELGGLIDGGAGMATSEAARVSALSILLDRAYGKARQPLEHSADEGLEVLLDRIGRSAGE